MSYDTAFGKVAEVRAAAKVSRGLLVTRENTLLPPSLTGNAPDTPPRQCPPPDRLALPAVRAHRNRRTEAGPQ